MWWWSETHTLNLGTVVGVAVKWPEGYQEHFWGVTRTGREAGPTVFRWQVEVAAWV